MINKISKIILPVYVGILAVPFVFAATTDSNPLGITGTQDIITILNRIIDFMYQIFFIAAVGFILWAAFTYLMAGQDAKKVEEAKGQLKYAVIAIVIALVAGGVSLVVKSFLKVSS